MNPTLDEIGINHGTDKSSKFHDYLRRYEPLFEPFRNQNITLIEIGVDGGASLCTWHQYFPNATIIGIDHNPKCADLRPSMPPRVVIEIGEATDPGLWQRLDTLYNNPSIIIDDGGHFSHQILQAWYDAWKLLLHGGLYVIEDLHHVYKHETPPRDVLHFLGSNLLDGINEDGRDQCGKRTTVSSIEWVQLSKSLAIIKKAGWQ